MLCWRCVLYKLTVFVFVNDIGPKWLYLLFVLVFERCICICIWKLVLSGGEVVTRSTRTATIGAFPMKHLPQCSNFSTIYISNLQYHTVLVICSKKSFCTLSGILLNTFSRYFLENGLTLETTFVHLKFDLALRCLFWVKLLKKESSEH